MGGQQKRTERRLKRKMKKYESKRRRREVKSNTTHEGWKSRSQGYGYGDFYLGWKVDNDKSRQRSRKNRSKQMRYERDTKYVYDEYQCWKKQMKYRCTRCTKKFLGIELEESCRRGRCTLCKECKDKNCKVCNNCISCCYCLLYSDSYEESEDWLWGN